MSIRISCTLAVAGCAFIAAPGGASAQGMATRADMEKTIIAATYRQACEEAKAQGQQVVIESCADNLVKTRGPAFSERLKAYPDEKLRALYLQYRPKS